jgi:hypothetical protein
MTSSVSLASLSPARFKNPLILVVTSFRSFSNVCDGLGINTAKHIGENFWPELSSQMRRRPRPRSEMLINDTHYPAQYTGRVTDWSHSTVPFTDILLCLKRQSSNTHHDPC